MPWRSRQVPIYNIHDVSVYCVIDLPEAAIEQFYRPDEVFEELFLN